MKTALSVLMLAAAAVAAPVSAQPAFDNSALSGSYHSVESRSYWSNGQFPKGFSLTITMTFGPNKLDYHGVNDTMPAKLYINDFHATLDDKPGPIGDNPRYNEIRIRQLAPGEFQVLEQKDGDVIVGQHWVFSKDHKTLTRWGVGKAPDGTSKAFLETFERVK